MKFSYLRIFTTEENHLQDKLFCAPYENFAHILNFCTEWNHKKSDLRKNTPKIAIYTRKKLQLDSFHEDSKAHAQMH